MLINNLRISRKRLRSLRLGSTIGLIAPRKSGKTGLIKWFLYYNHKKIRIPLLVSATAEMNQDYRDIIPDTLIYSDYNKESVRAFLEDQKNLKHKISDGEVNDNVKKDSVLILDDIVGTSKEWERDKGFQKMVFAGRHFNCTNIISVQKPLSIPADYRNNFEYLIICGITSKKSKDDLFNKFWNDSFGDKNMFNTLLGEITKEKYRFMLIDFYGETKPGKNIVESSIFWIKTHDPNLLRGKQFRVGNKSLWKANDKMYDPKWMYKKTKSCSKNITKRLTNIMLVNK